MKVSRIELDSIGRKETVTVSQSSLMVDSG